MKFEIEAKELIRVTNEADKFLEKNLQIPAYQYGLIKNLSPDTLIMTIQSERSIVIMHFKSGAIVPGSGLYPIKELKSLVNMLDDGIIKINIDNERITIKQGNHKYQRNTIPIDEFPSVQFINIDETVDIPAEQMRKIFGVEYASFRGGFKPQFNAVDVNIHNNKIRSMGTDTFMLATTRITLQDGIEINERVLMPLDMAEYLAKTSDEYSMGIKDGIVKLISEDKEIYIKTIKEKPINYMELLKEAKPSYIVMDREKMLKALKRMRTLSDGLFPSVTINKIKEAIYIKTHSEVSEGEEMIGVINCNDENDLNMDMNLNYLLETIKRIKGPTLKMQYLLPGAGESWRGVIFNGEDEGFNILIIPLKK